MAAKRLSFSCSVSNGPALPLVLKIRYVKGRPVGAYGTTLSWILSNALRWIFGKLWSSAAPASRQSLSMFLGRYR